MGVKIYVQGGLRMFRCPACPDVHQVNATWTWDGNLERPSFHPSILVRSSDGENVQSICHFIVTDGRMAFRDDCTHKFKGMTVEMPDWDVPG